MGDLALVQAVRQNHNVRVLGDQFCGIDDGLPAHGDVMGLPAWIDY